MGATQSGGAGQAMVEGASKLSEAAGGGPTLVFAMDASRELRLRAAAGFESPQAAQGAARALAGSLSETLSCEGTSELSAVPELGERVAGGVYARTLRCGSDPRGAVVWVAQEPLSPQQGERVAELFQQLNEQIAGSGAAPGASRPKPAAGETGHGDEVLRLSEALFAQDIELLRSREKLGTIERLKDDFIEKMSRELRTPLNHIIEAIISVLTGEDDALSEAAKTALRTALDEGTSFQRTLQNILDLWRIKQDELPVEVQDVNFRELVDEAIFSVQDTVGDRPVQIETELEEPLPRLRTDLTKLNQILFMLLDNAVKFTDEGTVRIIGSASEGELRVEIHDEGIGICHDDVAYVFDEFYQVDESESQKYRGAGLGLTLVRNLVALLDGEIALESDIGRGTRVTVKLPVQTL